MQYKDDHDQGGASSAYSEIITFHPDENIEDIPSSDLVQLRVSNGNVDEYIKSLVTVHAVHFTIHPPTINIVDIHQDSVSIHISHDDNASDLNITKYELQYVEQQMTGNSNELPVHEHRTLMIDADPNGSTDCELEKLSPTTKYAICARAYSSIWNQWSTFCRTVTLQTNQFFDFGGRVMLHDINESESSNISWINSIVHCLSNTLDLREYFLSSSFIRDVNQSDLSRITNEMSTVISKIWSNRTDSISHALPHLISAENMKPDPFRFLGFVLQRMHHDLSSDPGGDSKISDLFHFQCKSDVTCLICKKRSVSSFVDSTVSLPMARVPRKSFVVDIFHRGNDLAMVDDNGYNDSMNKPVRHVFHCNPAGIMKDLAKVIARKYRVKRSFVLFYENMNQQV